jgi:hypothetical protein
MDGDLDLAATSSSEAANDCLMLANRKFQFFLAVSGVQSPPDDVSSTDKLETTLGLSDWKSSMGSLS